jgi:hypothetical protein
VFKYRHIKHYLGQGWSWIGKRPSQLSTYLVFCQVLFYTLTNVINNFFGTTGLKAPFLWVIEPVSRNTPTQFQGMHKNPDFDIQKIIDTNASTIIQSHYKWLSHRSKRWWRSWMCRCLITWVRLVSPIGGATGGSVNLATSLSPNDPVVKKLYV